MAVGAHCAVMARKAVAVLGMAASLQSFVWMTTLACWLAETPGSGIGGLAGGRFSCGLRPSG